MGAKELFDSVSKSVVLIKTQDSTGTGFCIRDDHTIATCFHIVENAKSIQVITESGLKSIPDSISYDSVRDLAILQFRDSIGAKPIPLIKYSKTSIGENIYVVGHPLGMELAITAGIVSSKYDRSCWNILQHTAPVSPGSSGSPVLNSKRQCIGYVGGSLKGGQSMNIAYAVDPIWTRLEQKPTGIRTYCDLMGNKRGGKADRAVVEIYARYFKNHNEGLDDFSAKQLAESILSLAIAFDVDARLAVAIIFETDKFIIPTFGSRLALGNIEFADYGKFGLENQYDIHSQCYAVIRQLAGCINLFFPNAKSRRREILKAFFTGEYSMSKLMTESQSNDSANLLIGKVLERYNLLCSGDSDRTL